MSPCLQQTLGNPYVQFAGRYWYYLVMGLMLLWIFKRGVR